MWEIYVPTTLPKFNSSPLKSYLNPIGKDRLSTTIFQGRAVKLRGCKSLTNMWSVPTFCNFMLISSPRFVKLPLWLPNSSWQNTITIINQKRDSHGFLLCMKKHIIIYWIHILKKKKLRLSRDAKKLQKSVQETIMLLRSCPPFFNKGVGWLAAASDVVFPMASWVKKNENLQINLMSNSKRKLIDSHGLSKVWCINHVVQNLGKVFGTAAICDIQRAITLCVFWDTFWYTLGRLQVIINHIWYPRLTQQHGLKVETPTISEAVGFGGWKIQSFWWNWWRILCV